MAGALNTHGIQTSNSNAMFSKIDVTSKQS